MKNLLKFIPYTILFLIALLLIPPFSVNAQNPKSILITDITGQKEKVESPIFEYSAEHNNDYPEHFEVLFPGTPGRSSWVHFSQIKSATFEQTKKEPQITIVTESGKPLIGIFPDANLKIFGEGELAKASYPLKNIKTIEFVQFVKYLKDREITIDRAAASVEWKKSRKSEGVKSFNTIIDGKATIKAEGLQFRDSYNTNVRGSTIYFGRHFREGIGLDTIIIQRGASQVEVDLKDLETIEITGKKIEGRPELILTKKGGNKFTVRLLMWEWKSEDKTGDFGNI